MNYLIVGGEFNNKGAEAMTLVALSNIFGHDPNAKVFIWDKKTKLPFVFSSNITLFDCPARLLSYINGKLSLKAQIKELAKLLYSRNSSIFYSKRQTIKILKSIDVLIDISGYQLSSKWSNWANTLYCDWINVMKGFGSRIYLMPQSFGPFDYEDSSVFEMVSSTLKKCDKIFAREKNGYNELKALGLENVEFCYDSVLVEKNFDPGTVISNFEDYIEDIPVAGKRNVAIIPNYRLIDRAGCDYEKLLNFYRRTIQDNPSIDFYLTAHAGEDQKICKAIKDLFPDEERVHLVDHVLFSFNYQNFVKKIDFIIASRYHSIIHAYKECTPAVILGWSDKYEDVARLFEQTDYVIETENFGNATEIINKMKDQFVKERARIQKHLVKAQEERCYAFLSEINGNK